MSMSTDTDIETLPPVDLDDEEDLSKLDRGDNLPEDKDEEADDGAKRDEKGRFAKKDDAKTESEEEEEVEAKDDESEEEAEDDEGEDDEDDAKGKVPNAAVRLNKLRAQRDQARAEKEALAARIAALEAASGKKDPEPKVDPIEAVNAKLDALYEQVEEARADNDIKKAAQLQREIDAGNREIVRLEAERIASKTTTVAAENARYDAMLESYESSIPVIDPNHEDFDPDAVKALEFHVAAYEKMEMSPTKALKTAVALLFGDPAKKKSEAPAPKVEDKPKPKPKVDVKKAVDTQKRQPPDASDAGKNHGETGIKVTELSDEDFEKLPESKKAQLRGDYG